MGSTADAGIAGIAKNTGIAGVAEFSRNATKNRQNSGTDCAVAIVGVAIGAAAGLLTLMLYGVEHPCARLC